MYTLYPNTITKDNTVTLIKARDKWDAAYDLLNLLLKDTERYCNMCGAKWETKPCCESPQIGSNLEHLTAVVQQNKTKIANQKNALGMSENKLMRSSIAMPPVLFNEWSGAFERLYGEKLFKTPKDLHKCMRKMPYLMTCGRV